MSKNINQIATAATSILATDKMYLGRAPFGVTDDRYILGSSIITQFGSPLTTKGDIFTFSTVNDRLAVGTTNGQILQVNSAASVGLSWSTPTYPSASGTAGKIIISDGTNNIYSTPSYPVAAGTTGSIVISDGTNLINSTSLWPNTVGTALHLVLSNGTSNVYSTPAYPNASVTTGKFIISDGTNYIASTSIMPNTVGTAGTIIRSDGTVNTYSTATFADTYSASNLLYSNGANTVTGLATLANAVLVTNGSGVPSLSTTLPAGLTIPGYQPTITFPISLANGGTNASLIASTGGIFYSTASAGAILSGTATARQMLQSGATAAPAWSTSTWPATTTANNILFSSAANTVGEIASAASSVLITSAGSVPSLSQTLPSAVQANITTVGTITTGVWNGSVIGLTYGGTNANLAASASLGGIVYSTATAMGIIAGTATAGQMLQSGSTAAPTWSTAAWPATTTANQLLYSSTNNNVTGLATANNGVLITSGAGVPSISSTLPAAVLANIAGRLIATQIFSATTQTYTPTAGMVFCIAYIQAAGGGSGGVAGTIAQGAASGGGGGGGFVAVLFTAAQIGAGQTVAIPVGGTAGTSGNNNGGAASDTTFGSLVTCQGGQGGSGCASSAANKTVLGGAGGTVTVNAGVTLFVRFGSNGSAGISLVTTGANATGGYSFMSPGTGPSRVLGTSDGPGVTGANYGGGGSGAVTSNGTSYAGGAGAAGYVVVFEYS